MSGSTWRSVSGHGWPPLEVAADEAVVRQRPSRARPWRRRRRRRRRASWRGTSTPRMRRTPSLAFAAVDAARRACRCGARRCAPAASSASVVRGVRERTVFFLDAVTASPRGAGARAAAVPLLGSTSRTCRAVPLHLHLSADPAGRRAVVGRLDLDAAVEVHRALAVAGSSERARAAARAGRLLLGKHHRDLPLRRAVDARVRPALLPAVEVAPAPLRGSRSAGP